MRVVFGLLIIIAALVTVAMRVRASERGVSNVLLAFSGVFAVMLIGAFFGAF